jgi:hypothetical protein
MILTPAQVTRFYAIWFPLLRFVNHRRAVVEPSLLVRQPLDPADCVPVRDVLWSDNSLLEAYMSENPNNLSAQDLAVVRSWRNRVSGTFLVVKHLKKHSIFVSDRISPAGAPYVYAVVGLNSPFEETLLCDPPCMIKTVLVPFEGEITYDSLLVSFPVIFGRNMSANLKRDYQNAKKQGAIIESLERPALALVR